jgi:transcriptional regulator with XRE-family HTH domain
MNAHTLKTRLRRLAVTQRQLAAKIGVTPGGVNYGLKNENGVYRLIIELLEEMDRDDVYDFFNKRDDSDEK